MRLFAWFQNLFKRSKAVDQKLKPGPVVEYDPLERHRYLFINSVSTPHETKDVHEEPRRERSDDGLDLFTGIIVGAAIESAFSSSSDSYSSSDSSDSSSSFDSSSSGSGSDWSGGGGDFSGGGASGSWD